jgi:hypothetical protein
VTPDRSHVARLAADERGDVVLGWLAKVVVALTIVGILCYELVAYGAAKAGAADVANQAAIAASDSWTANHDVRAAYDAAASTAHASGGTVLAPSFRIDPDGTAHVSVRREASTILLRRIKPLRHYGVVVESSQARSVS